jgi:DNA-binding MarR family transcriptional regulator
MSTEAEKLHLVLSELRSHWKNFPVGHMLLFLEVARNDLEEHRLGVLEIGERLGVPQANVSRWLNDLSDRTIPTGGNEPINLVATEPDKHDHRKRIPVLTRKGIRVYQKILRQLGQRGPTNP